MEAPLGKINSSTKYLKDWKNWKAGFFAVVLAGSVAMFKYICVYDMTKQLFDTISFSFFCLLLLYTVKYVYICWGTRYPRKVAYTIVFLWFVGVTRLKVTTSWIGWLFNLQFWSSRENLETIFQDMKEECHRICMLAREQTDQLSIFKIKPEPETGNIILKLLLWFNCLKALLYIWKYCKLHIHRSTSTVYHLPFSSLFTWCSVFHQENAPPVLAFYDECSKSHAIKDSHHINGSCNCFVPWSERQALTTCDIPSYCVNDSTCLLLI